MIVDTSALIAILKREEDSMALRRALTGARDARMSVATWLEATIVARGASEAYVAALDELITEFGIEVVPLSKQHGETARRAHRRYGKGTGAKASLNFGDCFSYALAAVEQDELLFKGDDFTHTDIVPAYVSPAASGGGTSSLGTNG